MRVAFALFTLTASFAQSGCFSGFSEVRVRADGAGADVTVLDAETHEDRPHADAAEAGADVAPSDRPEDAGTSLDAGEAGDAFDSADAAALDARPPEDVVAPMDLVPQDAPRFDGGAPDIVGAGVRDAPGDDRPAPIDTAAIDAPRADAGAPDAAVSFPPIMCPLLGTPTPVTCRSRNGVPPCCGPGGICFCEQRAPGGNFCLPCS